MRLDHLLSRERIEEETRRFIPGRYKQKAKASKFVEHESAKSRRGEKVHEAKMRSGRMTVLLLEPVSFSGIESEAKAKLRNLNVL